MAETWEKAEPIRGLPADLAMSEAVCMRDELVKVLQRRLGRAIGYKAGLTSKAVQQRFGYDQPVRGVLLAGMLRPETRDSLLASFCARPVVEADLLVEVKDESINEARNHLDVLKALSDSPGTAILGHPLNAVLWLIDDLRRSGIRLKAGDVLSLGTFSPPLPARAATFVSVRYIGLPGDPEVAVRFR